jgi:hypothetical protein
MLKVSIAARIVRQWLPAPVVVAFELGVRGRVPLRDALSVRVEHKLRGCAACDRSHPLVQGIVGGKPGETGDRRDVPGSLGVHHGSKLNSDCLSSSVCLAGRPPFRGANFLSVAFSNSQTNSCDPNGRPVCVLCRTLRSSSSVSPASRYSLQLETSHRSVHGSKVSRPSGAVAPQ